MRSGVENYIDHTLGLLSTLLIVVEPCAQVGAKAKLVCCLVVALTTLCLWTYIGEDVVVKVVPYRPGWSSRDSATLKVNLNSAFAIANFPMVSYMRHARLVPFLEDINYDSCSVPAYDLD